MRLPNFRIITNDDEKRQPLLIMDVGPWDQYPTITNAAEDVVDELVRRGELPAGRRLFYIDSEARMDEITIKDGRFSGFAPLPQRGAVS